MGRGGASVSGRKGLIRIKLAKGDWSPEDLLILAVYLRARNDLFGKSKKWRQDAELFFEADGLVTPKRIRARYADN